MPEIHASPAASVTPLERRVAKDCQTRHRGAMTRRRLIQVLLLGGLGVDAALAAADAVKRASTPEVRKQVVSVIEGQLAAFRKSEVEKAYGYAAAPLRAQKSLRDFVAIVRNNYPEIWSNTRAEFGIVRDDGGQATVTVKVYSEDGDAAYDFTLAKEPAGWRIFGVLRHAPKQSGKA